ncbi:MAG: hypothetical protein KBT03_01450 [Bacteroidales bacterium]|nr:hypothetical protein [Candidatus Scybalousia scybalohippi]
MKTFEVNGKKYNSRPFDFNLVCDLEEMGVNLESASKKPMSLLRSYFAICANDSIEYAGNEMQKHIINGGSFDDLGNAMSDEMEKSDFFRSLSKTEETETQQNQSEKK